MIEEVGFATNPDPRCLSVLLLDTSASMSGASIEALNEGLTSFQQDIQQDDLARRRVDIAIVTFGNGGVQIAQQFTKAQDFRAPTLSAGGNTPMGAAILTALDMLQKRRQLLQENATKLYLPWVFLITDGAPTDHWQNAATRVHSAEQNRECLFFAVGVANADMDTLAQISVREPLKLSGLKFKELFLWLSESQKRVSASRLGEQVPLPAPSGWTTITV